MDLIRAMFMISGYWYSSAAVFRSSCSLFHLEIRRCFMVIAFAVESPVLPELSYYQCIQFVNRLLNIYISRIKTI